MNQWINKSMSQWIDSAVIQWINESVTQWFNERVNYRWVNEPMIQSEPMNLWPDESMNQRSNESTNHWTNENESGNECINESMNQYEPMKHNESSANAFFYSRLQTRIAERCTKSTKVRAASMLQRGLDHTNLELVCAPHEIKLSLKSGARFADLVFQKCHAPLARNIFVEQNRALTTVSCTFCQQRSPQPRKQRYPRSHISRKKTQGFAPESVFVRNFAAFLTLPNYLVMSAWHDDVVVMIMWLTWLWNAYHDYRP
jgi:hypothetical protein